MKKKSNNEYAGLRSALISRGVTLRGFALAHGYPVATVYASARGTRSGVISTKILNHLRKTIND